MYVIFNADDFGLTPGVNLGIAEASQSGVVRSTTMMVDMAAEKHAVQLASSSSLFKVGLHVRLTAGVPLTEAPCLVGDNGRFLQKENFWSKRDFSEQQIADEVTAQIEHFLATGLSLSHIDSHHHAHMHPQVFPVVQEIASGYQVPLRASGYHSKTASDCRYVFDDGFYGSALCLDKLLHLIEKHHGNCDVLEVMCHPAYIDQPLIEASAYHAERAQELDILTDKRLLEALDDLDIKLSDFSILVS
ncbi:chitin disaccharide deacetylase [Photobacterium sp. SDRW27]|uniref:chitin disaccharide deacetylase n=1 Tax=Photobacterium obscurum TaxID=2829490 RepID=UPI0022437154|nr:chitin disaccharide deacetylase [Photobacterium obscurum]MCW8330393.1 chitin disaccharide deacetylase [Photobacterium obscurum]